MTKRRFARRLTWVCLALCVVMLAFGLTTRLLSLIPGITEGNVRRIHIGMTGKEVAAILGEPADDGSLVVVNPPDDEIRRMAQFWEKLLDEFIETKDLRNQLTLKEALELLQQKVNAKYGADVLPIMVDEGTFKEEHPDAPDICDTLMQFPPFPRKMAVRTALQLALAKVPTNNATYLIRGSFIEITTYKRRAKECVTTESGLVVPSTNSRWEAWVESGTARSWTWSDEQLVVTVCFDENRQVRAIGRDPISAGRLPRDFISLRRR